MADVKTQTHLKAVDTAGDNVPKPSAGTEIAITYGPLDITRGYLLPDMITSSDDYILNQQGAADLRLWTEVLRDEQAKACFEQRRSAVTSCEYVVEPGGDRAIDKQAAAFLKDQLDKIGFDNVTDKALFGVWYGFMVAEIVYEPGDKYLEWKAIKSRNPRRFGFLADGSLRLRTMQDGVRGIEAPAPYFWTFNAGMEYDDAPYGKGLAHWCYWPVKFKRGGLKYWLIFSEKYGTPTAVGTFPTGASDPDKAALLAAVQAVSTDAAIIKPEGCTIDLVEAKRSGEAGYAKLAEYMDGSIAKAIVGQTMTTDNGSSKSQGEVHYTVRQDIVRSDANLICDSFNAGPVAWLIGLNFPTAALPRVKRVIEEPEDLNILAERDERLVSIGFRPNVKRVQEMYGDDYEPIPGWTSGQPVQPQQAEKPGGPHIGVRGTGGTNTGVA
jgi:phage gp29-like protein